VRVCAPGVSATGIRPHGGWARPRSDRSRRLARPPRPLARESDRQVIGDGRRPRHVHLVRRLDRLVVRQRRVHGIAAGDRHAVVQHVGELAERLLQRAQQAEGGDVAREAVDVDEGGLELGIGVGVGERLGHEVDALAAHLGQGPLLVGADVDEVRDELGLQGLHGGLDGLQVGVGDVERGALGDDVGVHACSPCGLSMPPRRLAGRWAIVLIRERVSQADN
jgi:hypothetical protein